MNCSDCKERLILVQQGNFMVLQTEYYVDLAKDVYEVGEVYDRESLFHFTNMPRKKLSKKGKLDYALKQLQEYRDEPLSKAKCDDWDNESKNSFVDSLTKRLQEGY
jgi:hypothetical protein